MQAQDKNAVDEKLKQFKQKLTLIEVSLTNATNSLRAGKVVAGALIEDLITARDTLKKQIARLEAGEEDNPPSSPLNLRGGQRGVNLRGGEGGVIDDEIGIPESLRFKRSYTMSDKALAARRAGSKKSTGPRTKEGKNKCKLNAWKHGKYAQNYILHKIKPCLSSCSHYPCELVKDGSTEPGGQCLDKSAVIQYYAAICEAVKNKRYEDFNELAAFTLAEQIHVVRTLMEDIQRDGTMLKRFKYDKDGNQLDYEVVPHPSLLSLAKLIDTLNLTPAEMMITPLTLAKQKTDNKKTKALSVLMSSFGLGESPGEDEEVEIGKGEDED